jgi:hypothetical protein
MGVAWSREGENVFNATKYPQVYLNWGRTISIGGHDYSPGQYGYYSVRGSELTGPWGFSTTPAATAGRPTPRQLDDQRQVHYQRRRARREEYIPNYYDDPASRTSIPSIRFQDKVAPRIACLRRQGDASLKVFGATAFILM